MTEAEWLACEAPKKLIDFLWNGVSDRKLRMFAVAWACYHVMTAGTNEPAAWRAIEACEQFTDGAISEEELIIARGPVFDDSERLHAVGEGNSNFLRIAALAAVCLATGLTVRKVTPQIAMLLGRQTGGVAKDIHVSSLHDIFGNPFRPVMFSPEWGTSTAVAIAKEMYDSRDFSAMPILADALQDAGCDNEDILNHCRQPGEHVRGCWVVDLLLGKS